MDTDRRIGKMDEYIERRIVKVISDGNGSTVILDDGSELTDLRDISTETGFTGTCVVTVACVIPIPR